MTEIENNSRMTGTFVFVSKKTKKVHGGQGSGDVEGHEFRGNQYGNGSLSTKTYKMTDSMKMAQRQKLSESIVDRFPPKGSWKDPRAYEIAEIAAHSFSSNGTQLVTADDKDGKVAGLVSFYVDPDGVNITYLASTGTVKHVGTDLLKKSIDMNPGKDINLYADPGAKTYYQYLGMHMIDDGGEGRGATYHWSADEAKKFSSIPKETMNRIVNLLSLVRLVHGGEGSGEPEGHDFRGNQYGDGGGGLKVTNDHKDYDKKLISAMGKSSNKDTGDKIAADQEKGLEAHTKYGKTFSEDDALNHYTALGYTATNAYLRGQVDEEKATKTGQFRKGDIAKIDAAIAGSPDLPSGLVMYRGVGERGVSSMMDMKPGDTCNDKAFQSFSTSPHNAMTFTTRANVEGTKGQHKVLIRAVSDGKQKGFVVGGGEHEIIMPRGTSWKVVSNNAITTGANAGRLTTHVITVVPA